VTVATTQFIAGKWVTTVPLSLAGSNTFLAGVPYFAAAGLPGALKPNTWSGTFIPSRPGITVDWKWAAAVYTTFGAPGSLGVKPVDSNKASVYKNSDHAGTPENFKQYVTGGAMGGGGSNWTGSYSATKKAILVCGQSPDPSQVAAPGDAPDQFAAMAHPRSNATAASCST